MSNLPLFLYWKERRTYLGKKFKWKYKVGDNIKDEKRNLIILNKYISEYVQKNKITKIKHYICKCNLCNYIGDMREIDLYYNSSGCPACCLPPRVVVEGINDIPTTASWMVEYFQGGYDEAKNYTKNSHKKIYPICPDCGEVKNKEVIISNLHKRSGFKCLNCNDGISFPEKFINNLLQQLNEAYIYQISKSIFKWCDKYRYDFYIKGKSIIIETHGKQHYIETNGNWDTLEKIKSNDKIKEHLANINDIKHYIVLDCRESSLEYIKNSIMDSKLPSILNFKERDINWEKCFETSLKSLVKIVSDEWNKNINISSKVLANKYNLSKNTIIKFLKIGTKLGWCLYNPKEEILKNCHKMTNNNCKKIKIYKNNKSLGIFNSIKELSESSYELYGIKLLTSGIGQVCMGNWKNYKGFTFKYM